MNNLSSYCGLVDARISSSEKDLPVYQLFVLFVDIILENCDEQNFHYVYTFCTMRSFLLLRNTVKIVLGCRVCMLYARPPVGTGKSFYEVEPTETRFNTVPPDSYFLMLSNHVEMAPKSYCRTILHSSFFSSLPLCRAGQE